MSVLQSHYSYNSENVRTTLSKQDELDWTFFFHNILNCLKYSSSILSRFVNFLFLVHLSIENISKIDIFNIFKRFIEYRLVNLLNILFDKNLIIFTGQFILINSEELMNPQSQKLVFGQNSNRRRK
jgi:hypothetical protein